MKKTGKIILSIFTPIIALLAFCLGLVFSKPLNAEAVIENGGGIYVKEGTTLNFSSGTIKGKSARSGGGICVYNATANITGGTITNNKATLGGGVYVESSEVKMSNGKITNNTAETAGGGVYIFSSDGVFTMNSGEISGNSAKRGGGVYAEENAYFVLNGGTITSNTATEGSAIYLNEAKLELKGGTISGTVEGVGDIYYTDCTFTSGYIKIEARYDGGIVLKKAPVHDIPIMCVDPKAGSVVAVLQDGVSPSQDILNHIKVQNMPEGTKLDFDGKNIVIKSNLYTLTFINKTPEHATLSANSITGVPHGSHLSIFADSRVFVVYDENGEGVGSNSVTATVDYENGYVLESWTAADGTILSSGYIVTGDMEITLNVAIKYHTLTVEWGTGGSVTNNSSAITNGAKFQIRHYNSITYNGSHLPTYPDAGITLDARANTGYEFDHWEVDGERLSDSLTVTKDITLKAFFRLKTYTVSIAVSEAEYGSVSTRSVSVTHGTTWKVSGSTLTLGTTNVVATPTAQTEQYSYNFISWYNEATSATLASSGTITGNMSITAKFDCNLRVYRVSVVVSPEDGSLGKLIPIGVGRPTPMLGILVTATYGTVYNVDSNNNLVFDTGDIIGAAPTELDSVDTENAFSGWGFTTGVVTKDMTITAKFVQRTRQYTVTFVASPSYAGHFTQSSIKMAYGSTYTVQNEMFKGSSTIYAVPERDCTLSRWSSTSGTITKDTTITVYFNYPTTKSTLTVLSNDETLGTVSPTSVTNIPYGTPYTVSGNKLTVQLATPVTITATPKADGSAYFSTWSCNESGGIIRGDTTIVAYFSSYYVNPEQGVKMRFFFAYTNGGQGSNLPTLSAQDTYLGAVFVVDGADLIDTDTGEVVLTAPTITGGTFAGYSSSGTGFVAEEFFLIDSANFRIYLYYTMNEYTVAIVEDTASSRLGVIKSTTGQISNVPYGATITISTGKVVINWNKGSRTVTASTSVSTDLEVGYFCVSDTVTKNTTIYSCFLCNITFEQSGNETGVIPGNIKVPYGCVVASTTSLLDQDRVIAAIVFKNANFRKGYSAYKTSEGTTIRGYYHLINWTLTQNGRTELLRDKLKKSSVADLDGYEFSITSNSVMTADFTSYKKLGSLVERSVTVGAETGGEVVTPTGLTSTTITVKEASAYLASVTSNGYGIIAFASGPYFTAKPASGYVFSHWETVVGTRREVIAADTLIRAGVSIMNINAVFIPSTKAAQIDVEQKAETAFIDKKKGTYAIVQESKDEKEYYPYDICYPK